MYYRKLQQFYEEILPKQPRYLNLYQLRNVMGIKLEQGLTNKELIRYLETEKSHFSVRIYVSRALDQVLKNKPDKPEQLFQMYAEKFELDPLERAKAAVYLDNKYILRFEFLNQLDQILEIYTVKDISDLVVTALQTNTYDQELKNELAISYVRYLIASQQITSQQKSTILTAMINAFVSKELLEVLKNELKGSDLSLVAEQLLRKAQLNLNFLQASLPEQINLVRNIGRTFDSSLLPKLDRLAEYAKLSAKKELLDEIFIARRILMWSDDNRTAAVNPDEAVSDLPLFAVKQEQQNIFGGIIQPEEPKIDDYYPATDVGFKEFLSNKISFAVIDTGARRIEKDGIKQWVLKDIVVEKFVMGEPDSQRMKIQIDEGSDLTKIVEFLEGAVVVGHNVEYDLDAITKELVDRGMPPLNNQYFCTYQFAVNYLPQIADYRIEGLSKYLRIYQDPEKPFHITRNDVEYTREIFQRLFIVRPDQLLARYKKREKNRFRFERKVKQYQYDRQENFDQLLELPKPMMELRQDMILTKLNEYGFKLRTEQGVRYFEHPYAQQHKLKYTDYEYQAGLLLQVIKNKRAVLLLNTGKGKTPILMMSILAHLLKNPQGRVMMITPEKILARQHYDANAVSEGPTMSFMALLDQELKEKTAYISGEMPLNKRKEALDGKQIITANAHVFDTENSDQLLDLKTITYLVVDEIHMAQGKHAMANLITKILKKNPKVKIIGATATLDKKEKVFKLIDSDRLIAADQNLIPEDQKIRKLERVKTTVTNRVYLDILEARDNLINRLLKIIPESKSIIGELIPQAYGPYRQVIMDNPEIAFKTTEQLKSLISRRITNQQKQLNKLKNQLEIEPNNKELKEAQSKIKQRIADLISGFDLLGAIGKFNYLVRLYLKYGLFSFYQKLQEYKQEREMMQTMRWVSSSLRTRHSQPYWLNDIQAINMLALRASDVSKQSAKWKQLNKIKRKNNLSYSRDVNFSTESSTDILNGLEFIRKYEQTLAMQYKDPIIEQVFSLLQITPDDVMTMMADVLQRDGYNGQAAAQLRSIMPVFRKELLLKIAAQFSMLRDIIKINQDDLQTIDRVLEKHSSELSETMEPLFRYLENIERDEYLRLYNEQQYKQILDRFAELYDEDHYNERWTPNHFILAIACLYKLGAWSKVYKFLERLIENQKITPELLNDDPKLARIVELVKANEGKKILIFCRTKADVHKTQRILDLLRIPAVKVVGAGGELGQHPAERDRSVQQFRAGEVNVMVATKEKAGTGLDIKGLEITINDSAETSATILTQTEGRVRYDGINYTIITSGFESISYIIGRMRKKKMDQEKEQLGLADDNLQLF